MSYNTSAYFGSQTGTQYTYSTPGYTTQVTAIDAWADSVYVYGLKLYWGSTYNYTFGTTPSGKAVDPSLDSSDIAVQKIRVYVDGFGILRGIYIWLVPNGTVWILGYDSGTSTLVYNDVDNALTNFACYSDPVGGITSMVAAKFYYTGDPPPAPNYQNDATPHNFLCAAELGWPALSALAHTAVVATALMKVGKLRSQLSIEAPSCDPPPTTSPSDTQMWHRTFRAQEHSKEMFMVYLPSILIASTLGYHVFGKWAPRVVGTLAFAGAFFRYKYLNEYIEDTEKREKSMSYASACMKPIFFLAVVSSGYLAGKQLYQATVKSAKSVKSSEDDEKNE